MKIFGICSGRANGNTEIMMKEAFMAIEAKYPDAECNFVRLQDVFIKACTGCENCTKHKLVGDVDFRCKFDMERDHYLFIETQLREADAVIVSSPSYNLMPVGPLVTFLNKMHASGDYREVTNADPFPTAAFSIGGTDWTNFTLPLTAMVAMEISGSWKGVVDKVHFDWTPAVGAVVLDPDHLARMRLLGERVADAAAAKAAGRPWGYVNNADLGLCPDCHGSMIERRADGWYCPLCQTKATLSMDGGELTVTFTEAARAENRWAAAGRDMRTGQIGLGHDEAAEHRKEINEARRRYSAYKQPIALPPLSMLMDPGAIDMANRR